MLYLQIVIWTLLVILGISYIATLITPLNTAEKDAKISYLYLLSCVLSSAISIERAVFDRYGCFCLENFIYYSSLLNSNNLFFFTKERVLIIFFHFSGFCYWELFLSL